MIRILSGRVAVVAAVLGLVACTVTAPTDVPVQPSIIIELPPESDSLLSQLNEAHFYITPPGGETRDTLLRFEPAAQTQRVRIQLRPDETVAGTVIDLELKDFGLVLFTGSVELTGGEEWSLSLVVTVQSSLTLVVSDPIVVTTGSSRVLSDLAWVRYANGTIDPDQPIEWSATNPEAAEVSTDRVTFPIAGSVGLVARWRTQEDTVSVRIR